MLSFRVDDDLGVATQAWADRLGIDRSEILRDALRRHLQQLAAEDDAETWEVAPLSDGEQALAHLADWGPVEDWADWADCSDGTPVERRSDAAR